MENTPKRTPILWILAILTMISSLFSAFTYLFWAIIPDYLVNSMESIKTMNMFPTDQVEQVLEIYTSIKSWQYLLLMGVEIMFFTGAFIMLVKLNKAGFHVYTIGKILEFCVLNFVIGGLVAMNFNGILMSILWVLMYATQLRFMGPVDKNNQTTSFDQK